jgi:hypothetical protein
LIHCVPSLFLVSTATNGYSHNAGLARSNATATK